MDNDLTAAQWTAIREAWAGCAYCQATDVPVQRDCIQPVSRGGRYTLENVVPACASCNASKHNGEVTAWLRRKKLDESTFLLRHAQILNQLRPATNAATPDAPDDTDGPDAPDAPDAPDDTVMMQ